MKMFFYAHCLSHINYASSVWCNTDSEYLKKLNRLHRRAIKLLVRDSAITTEAKYNALGILTMWDQFKYNSAILVFKQIHQLVPSYLYKLLPRQNARTLEFIKSSTSRLDLTQSGFVHSSISTWNSLPRYCKSRLKLNSFKCAVHKYFINNPTY